MQLVPQHIRRLVWVMQKGRPSRVVSLALLAALLVGQSPSAWSQPPAQGEVMRVAQSVPAIEPLTIIGTLDENSEIFDDGRYANVHVFEGVVGQVIVIEMISDGYNPVLGLIGPGDVLLIRENDGRNQSSVQWSRLVQVKWEVID